MGSAANILLIEDSEIDYRLTERLISKIANDVTYHVDWCWDFKGGLTETLKNKHDIYFVDFNLGTDNGLDLVAEAREHGHEGPFVLLTATDRQRLYDKSMETGVYDYVLKSEISPSMLERTIAYTMERKRIEDQLRFEKEFSSFIISEIPYLVVGVDKQGLISSANPCVTRMTGAEEKDLIGESWKILIAGGENFEISYQVTDNDHIGFEARLVDKLGKTRHIYWNVLNKKAGFGPAEDLSFVLSGKDMTEQMETEEQERQRQKTEALGEFAGGAAHEINNLLQPILFSADIIKAKVENAKLSESAEKIIRNTQSAGKIVDDILTYARKEAQDNQVICSSEALRLALELTEDMLDPSVRLVTEGLDVPQEAQVLLNPNDMFRVVKNVVMNAAHAMGCEGEVRVKLETVFFKEAEQRLDLIAGPYVKIQISDTGCGMDKQTLERVFDPFFTTKDIGKGTGLGLSIVYNIIKSWRGAIDVQSNPGQGTDFIFYVPVHQD